MRHTYLTDGREIETHTVEWTTSNGTTVTLSLLRNAKLGLNGYLASDMHDLYLAAGNRTHMSYDGLVDHAEHGLCIGAQMSSVLIKIPAEHIDAVRALLDERKSNNDAAWASREASEREYQDHVAAVNNMMTLGGRTY
jgi:hypothetical protein